MQTFCHNIHLSRVLLLSPNEVFNDLLGSLRNYGCWSKVCRRFVACGSATSYYVKISVTIGHGGPGLASLPPGDRLTSTSTSTTTSTSTSASTATTSSTIITPSHIAAHAKSSPNLGLIIGATVGGAAVFAVIFTIIVCSRKRHKQQPNESRLQPKPVVLDSDSASTTAHNNPPNLLSTPIVGHNDASLHHLNPIQSNLPVTSGNTLPVFHRNETSETSVNKQPSAHSINCTLK